MKLKPLGDGYLRLLNAAGHTGQMLFGFVTHFAEDPVELSYPSGIFAFSVEVLTKKHFQVIERQTGKLQIAFMLAEDDLGVIPSLGFFIACNHPQKAGYDRERIRYFL
jgi:hypothetical protein